MDFCYFWIRFCLSGCVRFFLLQKYSFGLIVKILLASGTASKILHEENGGWISVIFGFIFILVVVFAFFFFKNVLS